MCYGALIGRGEVVHIDETLRFVIMSRKLKPTQIRMYERGG